MSTNDEWLTPLAAVRLLSPKYGERAKAVIISRCERGLLEARAAILVTTYHNAYEEVWNGAYERTFPEELEDRRQTDVIIPSAFWDSRMAFAEAEGVSGEASSLLLFAEWEIGDFGFKTEWDGNEGPAWQRTEASDVRFNREQVVRLLGGDRISDRKMESDPAKPSRSSKYDWEGAIAAFGGAQNKLDIVPDLYAYGALAVIERWMADWFSLSGDCPAEATIRNKAKRVLEAYQKADLSAQEEK